MTKQTAHRKKANYVTPGYHPSFPRHDPMELLFRCSSPAGVEALEREHQREAIRYRDRLPRFYHYGHYSPENAAKDEAATREVGEAFGFAYGEVIDEIFVAVNFPEGWRLESTSHAMHNRLLDAQGRERATMFYKGDFWDRKGDMSWTPRFRLHQWQPENWFQLTHPVQPERLYKEGKTEWVRCEPGIEVPYEEEHNYRWAFPGYDSFGVNRNMRAYPTHKKVVRRVALPEDQQPKRIEPQGYWSHFEFQDRQTGAVIFRGESFWIEPPEKVGYSSVNEETITVAHGELRDAIDEHFPNYNSMRWWDDFAG